VRIERKTAGSVTILACAGEFDGDGVRALDEKTGTVVGTGCHRLVVSLGEMKSFDSTALACLISVCRRLNYVDGEVVVSSASGFLQTTIKTLGLTEVLKVFPDDRAALDYFGEDGGDFTGSGARREPPRPSDSAGAWPEEHPRPRP